MVRILLTMPIMSMMRNYFKKIICPRMFPKVQKNKILTTSSYPQTMESKLKLDEKKIINCSSIFGDSFEKMQLPWTAFLFERKRIPSCNNQNITLSLVINEHLTERVCISFKNRQLQFINKKKKIR